MVYPTCRLLQSSASEGKLLRFLLCTCSQTGCCKATLELVLSQNARSLPARFFPQRLCPPHPRPGGREEVPVNITFWCNSKMT